ncbi:hypothetical protein B0H11DRAFT_2257856 [Mycena galericulata]|nr:hypothetical protein B0H11DRAFT_2257856 [Mycena galericulata]
MSSHINPLTVQELLDSCIDFLHASPPDLKACALVSRSWTDTAQMHLFNHIVIGFNADENFMTTSSRRRSRLLCQVLATSPRLIRWVESIQIHLDASPLETLECVAKFAAERLRRIHVVGSWVGSKMIAIQALLGHRTLTAVSISGGFESLSAFMGVWKRPSASIKDISFGSVRIPASNSNTVYQPTASHSKIYIESFTLWWSDGIHDWLNSDQCPFDFSNLKRLCLNENTSLPRWTAFAPFIPRVEYLQFEPLVPGLDLAPFTNLKCISIFIGSLEYRAEVSSAFKTLSTMAPSNQIDTLRFQLSNVRMVDSERGADLDRRILALPLPQLKAVELFYFAEMPLPADVTEKLPLLNARKLVRAVCG